MAITVLAYYKRLFQSVQLVILLVFMLSGIHFVFSDESPLNYNSTYEIEGFIQNAIFPGQPNYYDYENGDEEEIYWFLFSIENKDFNQADEVNVIETNQNVFQLILTNEQYIEYQKFLHRRVVVTGSFLHSISGHHKTNVLIKVERIELKI